jgi:hypothetical protein
VALWHAVVVLCQPLGLLSGTHVLNKQVRVLMSAAAATMQQLQQAAAATIARVVVVAVSAMEGGEDRD